MRLILFLNIFMLAFAAPPTYFPLRPPSLPLAVRSPYTSAWSSASNGDTLNTRGASFYPFPSPPLGWEGVVTVDGTSYEWLGTLFQNLPEMDNFKQAQPLNVSYDSQYSNYTFSAGPVQIAASFLSPVIPKDLCRTSVPLSYLTVSVQSSGDHNISLYGHVNGLWLSNQGGGGASAVNWTFFEGNTPINGSSITNPNSTYSWQYTLKNSFEFAEDRDKPSWGNLTYSSRIGNAQKMTYQSGYSHNLLYKFITQGLLNDSVDSRFRVADDQDPAFGFAHNLGTIGANGVGEVTYTIGTVQQKVINYLTSTGLEKLDPWWKKCYGDSFSMIDTHFNDLAEAQRLASLWESQLKIDVDKYYDLSRPGEGPVSSNMPSQPANETGLTPTGFNMSATVVGEGVLYDPTNQYGFLNPTTYAGVAVPGLREKDAYYAIVALSARQIMGAHVLANPPTGKDQSEPLIFQKEISSDGNVNTADVLYPTMPFFLYANPNFLRLSLEPLYQAQEGNFYPNNYAMHDLGRSFPNATGHIEGGEEPLKLEATGNMVIMSLAYAQFSNNASWLKPHYSKLHQWSQYLVENCLIPENQKSTDDFGGNLTNQTNLAIKGIIGIKAMGQIALLTGNTNDAANLTATASNYSSTWESLAVNPQKTHTLLSYDWRGSYGLLYNTFADVLLGLGVVPQRIHDMQSAWYPTVSQQYGIPLDNRNLQTKSDWQIWAAATSSASTRALIVTSLGHWLNETHTNIPFVDLYDTGTGDIPVLTQFPGSLFFPARPVVGGHFALLALGMRGYTEGNTSYSR